MTDNEDKACDLCGLRCGRHPVEHRFEGKDLIFCCNGCMNVYAILLESDLVKPGVDLRDTELFQRSLKMGLIANPIDVAKPQETKPARDIPPDTPACENMLQVSGMWCSACAWLIEHALTKERGVESAQVYFASDLVKVKYYPQFLPPDWIQNRISDLGYQASEYTAESETADEERKDLLLRLGVAVFFWIHVMTLNVGIYAGYFQEIPDYIVRTLPYLLMVLSVPPVFYSARPIIHLAWRGILNRAIRMETLLALGILSAFFYSLHQTFTGGAHVYFDTTCALVTLVLIGKWFERAAKDRTSRTVTLMYKMMPGKARMSVGGRERFVSIDALQSGDTFVVKAGERIPADGVVSAGESYVDESLLTGESLPVTKKQGDKVVGGSINVGSVLHVTATKVGSESTLAHIVKAVETAIASRSAIEKTVDRVSRVFVPGVILTAVATFAGVWALGESGAGNALMRGITVLVIACPCALGIATPLAITAAVGRASRNGILVSDSRVLETIRNVDVVVLDKTGTITEGDFALVVVSLADLPLLASLEAYSEHPLGRAVTRRAHEENLDLEPATDIEVMKGLGITGSVDSRRVFIGNRRMVSEYTGLAEEQREQARAWENEGRTVAFYGWDANVKGVMAFGDRPKKGARELVRDLDKRGVRTMLVSGDSHATTAWVASQVHAHEFHAEALPEDKARIVENIKHSGRIVAMVGDGINDAPALAAADLGIAMGSGTDLAMKAASMVLMSDDLHKILEAFDLSRKTMTVVRQNLFWAFIYNSVGITLAVAGLLSPILAAGAMVVSSLSVIGNSLRLSLSTGPAVSEAERLVGAATERV
jgi:heavy metal translocating P-type ATPase